MVGPLSNPNDPYNYEDKLLSDVLFKKMRELKKEAEEGGYEVTSNYYGEGKNQPSLKTGNKMLKRAGIPENYMKGKFYANPKDQVINAPMTPTLFNYLTLAEETEHGLNAIPLNGPLADLRYIEEKRAKDAALEKVGGRLSPIASDVFQKTRDSYKKDLIKKVNRQQSIYDRLNKMKNINTNFVMSGNYATKEDKEIFDLFKNKGISPKEYYSSLYPEVFKNE
jgi:hypothetical protein